MPGVRYGAGQRAGGGRLLLAARRHTRWSSAIWSSGSCASPPTRRSCSTVSTSWTAGRKKCAPCSATGSAAAKARRSTSASRAAAQKIRVFTTRVDTIFGATSVQLAPEHPLVATFSAADANAKGAGRGAAGRAEEGQGSRRRGRHRETRRAHRPFRHQSLQRRARAHLGGELHPDGLRHRRHHERARPRRTRL